MRPEVELAEYAPMGSDIYYVLRQVPEGKELAYLAVHAFATELAKISEAYREAAIAQQKLSWWHEEIKRLYQGEPTHPITKALAIHLKNYDLKEIEFLAMIEGAMLTISTQIFTSEASLRQHYQHTGGIIAQMKAKILTAKNINLTAEFTKCIHQLGVAHEIVRHLLNFPKFLQRQHLYLPLSLFQQHELDPQPILLGENLYQLPPLLHDELVNAQTLFNQTISHFTRTQKKAFRPLILEVKLKLIQTKKIANHAWKIFDYRLELSPVLKFLYTEFTR